MDNGSIWIALATGGGFALISKIIDTVVSQLNRKEDKQDEKEDQIEAMQKLSQERFDELKEGLEEREATGQKRFEMHAESIEKMQKLETLIVDFMIGLGHDKLVFLTDHIAERGGITVRERATLDAIWEPYHASGGNGDGEAGYKAAIAQPTITEDEAKEADRRIRRRAYGIDMNSKEDKS